MPNGSNYELVEASDTHTQSKTSSGLIDIQKTNAQLTELKVYGPDDITGFSDGEYQIDAMATALKSWRLYDPSLSDTNELWIIYDGGLGAVTNKIVSMTNGWEITLPESLRKESFTSTSLNSTQRSEVLMIYTNTTLKGKVEQIVQTFPSGEEQVQVTEGTGGTVRTTTYEYYTDTNDVPSFSRLKQVVYPEGSWQYFYYGTNQLPSKVLTGFLNQGVTTNENLCFATEYEYTTADAAVDDGTEDTFVPRRTIKKLKGIEIGRSYMVLTNGVRIDIRCQTPGAAVNAADNLITTNIFYTNGPFANTLWRVVHPDKTLTIFSNAYNGTMTQLTNAMCQGVPDGAFTSVTEGRLTTTVYGELGELLSRSEADLSQPSLMIDNEVYSYGNAQKTEYTITYLDGSTFVNDPPCCGLGMEKARDGSVTSIYLDALSRTVARSKNGIMWSNVLDSTGNVLKELRVGGGTTLSLNQFVYDEFGRQTTNITALNATNVTVYSIDGQGQRVVTITYHDGGTRIETYAKDGSLMTVEGTATFPMNYDYGVEYDGEGTNFFTMEINAGQTNEWKKVYSDMMGRSYKTMYSAPSGQSNAVRKTVFNELGQVVQEIDEDGVGTVFLYNALGGEQYRVLDVSAGTNFASLDRIIMTTNDVISSGALMGIPVRRTRTYVWKTDNVNASNLLSTVEVSLDGRTNWTVIHNGGTDVITKTMRGLPDGSAIYFVTNTAPDGSVVVSEYNSGRLTNVTQKIGATQIRKTTYQYDSQGRRSALIDARNGSTVYGYNNADQATSVTTPVPGTGRPAQTTTTIYDAMGRAVNVILSDGAVLTNEYTLRGELQRQYGGRTYPTGYGYDAQGRMTRMTNWSGFSLTSPTGERVTAWVYDSHRGWMTNKLDASGNGAQYTYTVGGKLETRAWARNVTATYGYHATSGDLTSVSYSDGTPSVTYTQDRQGRQKTVARDGMTTTFAYNDAGLVLSESYSGGTLGGLSVTNSYSSALQRSSVTVPGKTSLTFGYDGASRLTNVTDGTFSAEYDYFANSGLVGQIAFKQSATTRMTTTRQFDYLNRLLSISSAPALTSELPASFQYQYNEANQRTRATLQDGSFWIYEYDGLGQVVSGKRFWSDGTPVAGQQFEYGFDTIGNRTTTKEGGNENGANLRSATYANNTLNQVANRTVPDKIDLVGIAAGGAQVSVNSDSSGIYRKGLYFWKEQSVSNNSYPTLAVEATAGGTTNSISGEIFIPPATETFGYDLDGNTTNDGRWILTWDGENRLIQQESKVGYPSGSQRKLVFEYDAQGRRIKKTVYENGSSTPSQNLKFVYDGWNLLAELNATNNAVVRTYVWGPDLSGTMQGAGGVGGLVAVKDSGGTGHFAGYDGNGNVVMLVNGTTGGISEWSEYGPFGELIRQDGTMAAVNPFQFSTKFTDIESGLLYYGYRYYVPGVGCWPNRDPLEEEGGVNLYGFVGNDPANTIDPLGQDFIAVGGLPVPTMPVLGIGVHMSLRYYKASCSDNPKEGVRFSPGSPPKGAQYEDAVQLWTAWHSYRHFFYVRPKPTAPPERTFVFIPISYIERASAATRLLVLYSDADNGQGSSEKGWKKIIAAAGSYAYAEQADANGNVPTSLSHWPNSWYQLLGNNSNTFIRQMAKLIGRNPDAIGGGWIAGRTDPEPVSNPGWTPVYSPW